MSAAIDRKLLVEAVIMLAGCVGGWLMLVEPRMSELAGIERKIAEAKNNPLLATPDVVEHMAAQLDDVRARAGHLRAQNRLAEDPSQVYGLIMDLAEEHRVVVHRLEPASRSGQNNPDATVKTSAFNMSVEGRYEQVASFLEDIEGVDGFMRAVSLRLAPRGEKGSATTTAQFTCEALAFPLPEALLAMVEETSGADE